MKFFKWKIFLKTAAICLAPILLGVILWDKLPETMAIHFDINNNPDNFASKGFVVFALPCLMVLLQAFCCFINDINAKKHGDRPKFEKATKWIIPAMSVILQPVTLLYGLGVQIDIRRVVAVIVAIIFVVIGNYQPKLDYVKNADVDTEKARKINRFIGFEAVVMGVLFFLSIFFPPVATIVCLFLLIPFAVISVSYGIYVGKKK